MLNELAEKAPLPSGSDQVTPGRLDASQKSLDEINGMPGTGAKNNTASDSAKKVKSGLLPDLHLSDAWHDISSVAAVMGQGALAEVENNPMHLVESAATGMVSGIALSAVAAVSPEIAIGAGVLAVGYGAYEVGTHLSGWTHDADVVAHPENYSRADVAAGTKDIQGLGAGAADMAAGIAGGIAGGALVSNITRTAGAFKIEQAARDSWFKTENRPPLLQAPGQNYGEYLDQLGARGSEVNALQDTFVTAQMNARDLVNHSFIGSMFRYALLDDETYFNWMERSFMTGPLPWQSAE
jgi:hypothetical protein